MNVELRKNAVVGTLNRPPETDNPTLARRYADNPEGLLLALVLFDEMPRLLEPRPLDVESAIARTLEVGKFQIPLAHRRIEKRKRDRVRVRMGRRPTRRKIIRR